MPVTVDQKDESIKADALRNETAGKNRLVEAYYLEQDPEKRRQLLSEIGKTGEDSHYTFRIALFEKRFQPLKGEQAQYADRFLRAFMDMIQAQNNAKGLFGSGRRQMAKTLKLFCREDAVSYGREGEAMLHREIVNAALRYFNTCMSPDYRRKLFGTMMPSDKERRSNIRRDAWAMSYGIGERFGLKEESVFLCEAVSEAYKAFDPDALPLERRGFSADS